MAVSWTRGDKTFRADKHQKVVLEIAVTLTCPMLPLLLLLVAGAGATVKFDCYPEPGASQDACQARGCIWEPTSDSNPLGEPWCHFPANVGYRLAGQSGNQYTLQKTGFSNPFGGDISQITLKVNTIGSVLNVKIGVDGRYEPPVEFPRQTIPSGEALDFTTGSDGGIFNFAVSRRSTRRNLFDTSLGGLVFSDQFIQIATYLPSENMYGWGENVHQSLKHDFSKYLTWSIFARDQPPNSGSLDTVNLYGVHPYYLMIEPDGKAHGVLILNSNAQEVTTVPGPAYIYRTIGGNLDIYFFPGPTAELVTQQYLNFVGKPFLPAYWALGYQLSRYGYKGLAEMKARIEAVRDYSIPIDTGVADIDYMQRYKDFTTGDDWAGFGDYIKQLHGYGMKLILIFDPAIEVTYDSFSRAKSAGAKFIEWESNDQVMRNIQDLYPLAKDTKIMLGVVWPDKHVGFPDFLDQSPRTEQWWIDEFVRYHGQAEFDGIWIDMNEPSNFGTNQDHPWYYDSPDHPNAAPLFCPRGDDARWDMPPYKTHAVWRFGDGAYLATNTLCMLAVQQNGSQRFYNTKNLYGWSESRSTQKALFKSTGKRGAVISRSTFPSSGRYAGHWLGDNTARWEDLRTSIIGAQEFNLFGIPYVGSDVCGFIGTTTEELCLRWQQMGAFHSFFRNHNTIGAPAQDPAVWPSVAAATRKANLFRYQYLPYLFSLHFVASRDGATVIRPLFFEFPTDSATLNRGTQFMWGGRILVAPVYEESSVTVAVYLPSDLWYSLSDQKYGVLFTPGTHLVGAPTTSMIPVFVRGGSVIPRQTPDLTTTATRKNPFELLVAPDSNGNAVGSLFWDDGETIVIDYNTHQYHQFEYVVNTSVSGGKVTIKHVKKCGVPLPTLDIIEVFNQQAPPNMKSFKINGSPVNVNVQKTTYSAISKRLYISTSYLIDLTSSDTITFTWDNLSNFDAKSAALRSNRFELFV